MTIDATEHRYVNKTESAFSRNINLQAIFHEHPLSYAHTERQAAAAAAAARSHWNVL